MAYIISKRTVQSSTPLRIPVTSIPIKGSDRKGFFADLFQGRVAYSVSKDAEHNNLHVYCSPDSEGLPMLHLDNNHLVLDIDKRSKGTSLQVISLNEPRCPKPKWDAGKTITADELISPSVSADTLNAISCTQLQSHLTEVYQVLVKKRRNSAQRTWILGRSAAGTYACINESNRFIRFESLSELMDWGAFLERHFFNMPGPYTSFAGTNTDVCIIDCLDQLPCTSKIGVLKLFESQRSTNSAVPELRNPKKCWTLIRLKNGFYAACNSSKNQTWFVDHTFAGVLGNIKSDFNYYAKSPNHSVEWESDIYPDLFVDTPAQLTVAA